MSVPNLIGVVQAVRASQPWTFKTKSQLCAYSQAVIAALHRADPRFGHLAKGPNNNHCTDPLDRRVAVDVALFRPTGQIIDFMLSHHFGDPYLDEHGNEVPIEKQNQVVWGVGPEGEYTADDWLLPVDVVTPIPPTDPELPPMPPGSVTLEQLKGALDELLVMTVDIGKRAKALELLHQEVMDNHIGKHNEQIADLYTKVRTPASDHVHRLFGIRTGGPE